MRCPHCGGPLPSLTGKKSPEKVAEVLELAGRGYSLRDIQEITGVSFSTAGRIVRSYLASATVDK